MLNEKRTIIRTKHVDFVESRVYADRPTCAYDEIPIVEPLEFQIYNEEEEEPKSENNMDPNIANSENSREQDDLEIDSQIIPEETEHQPPQKSKKEVIIGGNKDFDFVEEFDVDEEEQMACLIDSEVAELEKEPQTYSEAVNSSESEKWTKAINEELNALIRNGTWKIVPRAYVPKGMKIVKARWVNKRKQEANGGIRYM